MNASRAKATQTRLKRLTLKFNETFGRDPTVDELNALYSQEMRDIAAKSSRNRNGTGLFSDKAKAREYGAIGGRKSKRGKAKK